MPRPRTPTVIKKMTGTFQASRHNKYEPNPTQPLGDAPAYFTIDEQTCWFELQTIIPAGVMTIADRWATELACVLMAKLRRREPMLGHELARLASTLSLFGMTPADRSRVVAAPQAAENPYDFLKQ